MIPTAFDEDNAALGRPQGMTDEECAPLSVFIGNDVDRRPVVISCWKLTDEELAEVIRTRRVWVIIHGETMPPIAPTGISPFVKIEEPTC